MCLFDKCRHPFKRSAQGNEQRVLIITTKLKPYLSILLYAKLNLPNRLLAATALLLPNDAEAT